MSSAGGGDTWTQPRRIGAAPSRAAAYPSVAAGAGRAAAVDDAGATGAPGAADGVAWHVFVARSRDGGRHLVQAEATDVVHRGAVCVGGDACGFNDSRALLDLTSAALDRRSGVASAAYTTDPDFQRRRRLHHLRRPRDPAEDPAPPAPGAQASSRASQPREREDHPRFTG